MIKKKKKNRIADFSSKGGKARWAKVSKEERSKIGRENAKKMWSKIKSDKKKLNVKNENTN